MDKLYTYNSNNYSNIENSNFHYYRFHFDLLKPAAAPKSLQSCPTPQMAAHQAPPSLGFSRQEQWDGLPFPSSVRETEVSPVRIHGLQPTRLLPPWYFPGKNIRVGCCCLLTTKTYIIGNFKAPKLSGHLVDGDHQATTKQHKRQQDKSGSQGKAQHHHSARVPSEWAGGCISHILPFTRVEVLLKLGRPPSTLHRTAPDVFCVSNMFDASDRQAQAGLEPGIGRSSYLLDTFLVTTRGEGTCECVIQGSKVNGKNHGQSL